MNKVSAIIVTYNRRNLVARAVGSVLAQQDCEIELIVVDDCSSDGSFDYVEEKYGQVATVLSTPQHSGYGGACNVGFRNSTGTFIALLGDDDYWVDPLKVSKQIKIAEQSETVGLVGSWWVELDAAGSKHPKQPIVPVGKYQLEGRMLISGGLICGSTALVRRSAWETVKGMDPKQPRGVDSDFFRRIVFAGYRPFVMRSFSTHVEIGHGLGRMTARDSTDSRKQHLLSQLRVIRKHFPLLLVHPKALLYQVLRLCRAGYRLVASSRIASNLRTGPR